MAKKQSPRKPARKGKQDRVKPATDKSEPEKVKIGPLDPPPPQSGGGTTTEDENQDT